MQTNTPSSLENKVILITGAAAGLGRALSLATAAQGATVILLDSQVRPLEKLYDEIVEQGYPEPAIYPLDMRGANEDDYQELAASVTRSLGGLDMLVHNAATLKHLTPLQHHSTENWYEVLQVNLSAPFMLTRACLPLLIEAGNKTGHAAMLFIDDNPGDDKVAYMGAYGVAKAGLMGLMRIVANEVEENTRLLVAGYDPGPLQTALRARMFPMEKRADTPTVDSALGPLLSLLRADRADCHGTIVRNR